MTDEDEGEEGKLPSVDHGRRTDRGRDKKREDDILPISSHSVSHIGEIVFFRLSPNGQNVDSMSGIRYYHQIVWDYVK
jgi:hypothetical protein